MSSTMFHVGQRLNNFSNVDVTIQRIAAGAFGQVAMGPNRLLDDTWVAVKALRPDVLAHGDKQAHERLRANFLRESLTWCGLWPHANLLTAMFVTEINGELMLVLDYATGGSMRTQALTALQEGVDPSLRLCLIFAQQIAAGLVELHTPAPELMRDHPIVHRDLKPENILIGRDNLFKITDFGLAKAAQDLDLPIDAMAFGKPSGGWRQAIFGQRPRVSPTQTQMYQTQRGAALGTPIYMAPEQWIDAALADCPADAYAFGLILAELLTGQHPLLDLDRPTTIDDWRTAHLSGRPRSLRTLRRAGTAGGRDMVEKLMTEMLVDWYAADQAYMSRPPEQNVDIDYPSMLDEEEAEEVIASLDALVAALLLKQPEARPTMQQALTQLHEIARVVGIVAYSPPRIVPDTDDFARIWWEESANSYLRFGQYADALARIERAAELDPDDPSMLFTYGRILQELGRTEEALLTFRRSLACTASDSHNSRGVTLGQIGVTLKNLGRYAEAEATYAESVVEAPANGTAWYNRSVNSLEWANTEAQIGHRQAARAHIEDALLYLHQAIVLNPDSPRYRELYDLIAQRRQEL